MDDMMGPDAGMPPMGPGAGMPPAGPGAGMPPEGPGQSPMDDMGGDMDGGPEPPMDGGPEDDGFSPKKDIQQQTGTLSQALGEYNNEQETPDTELSKYVMNMLAKQAGKALTPKDKRDVMKKLNSSDEETAEDMEDETEMDMEMGDEQQPKMESRRLGRIIDEVLNDEIGSKRNVKRKKVKNNDVTEKNPFVCGI